MAPSFWRNPFQGLPSPVAALGANNLYLVSLEGFDFVLPMGEPTKPVVGFFTHKIVAARTEDEAKLRASDSIVQQWRDRGYERVALKLPSLTVDTVEQLPGWFRFRSGAGFTFHRGQ